MNELWLDETAGEFWQAAGGYGPDFELAVLLALPVTIERLDGLSVGQARDWLSRQRVGLAGLSTLAERPLRACLVALGGDSNFILLDRQDTPDEQLFSLAHEVAHFLLDYLHPRRQARQKLSEDILPVLDGLRPATPQERTYGLLANLSLRPYQHLMERPTANDTMLGSVIWQAEERADRLAIELLAPRALVLPRVKEAIAGMTSYPARQQIARQILSGPYRLPPHLARDYAQAVLEEAGGGRTFREWLGLS